MFRLVPSQSCAFLLLPLSRYQMEAAPSSWATSTKLMLPSLLPSLPFHETRVSCPCLSHRRSTDRHRRQPLQRISASRSTPVPLSSSESPASASLHGLVFDAGSTASWDSRAVGSPVVKRYLSDDVERWLMWYHGSGDDAGGDSIGIAISEDGIHWERGAGAVESSDAVGQVMRRSSDWWAFDTVGVRPSDVLIMSSDMLKAPGAVYWLYYTGFSQEKVEAPGEGAGEPSRSRLMSLPGLAISQDGRYWARIEGGHHSGAVFDVGSTGEWDSLFVESPKVIYHCQGDLRMYYHSIDRASGSCTIGIARSRDGMRWAKLGKVLGSGPAGSFDDAGVRNASVVRNQRNGLYLMAYEGISVDGATSIGLAASSDGLKEWRRCGGGAILEPSTDEDGWDDGRVSAPCLLQITEGRGEQWRLYYTGVGKNGRMGIGMAVSEGPDICDFQKWVNVQP